MNISLVGFDTQTYDKVKELFAPVPQQPVRVPMYQSKSKGLIPITSMNSQHLVNAFRKHFIAAIQESYKDLDVKQMIYKFNNTFASDVIRSNETLEALFDELKKRGLAWLQ